MEILAFDAGKDSYDFNDLLALLHLLRSPEGCPWDRKQTLASLQKYLLEETYESLAAYSSGDMCALSEELGDVLLQVVFQSQIASETAAFDIHTVIDKLVRKLVTRHSHLFGTDIAHSAEEVAELWQKNKTKEKEAALAEADHADTCASNDALNATQDSL